MIDDELTDAEFYELKAMIKRYLGDHPEQEYGEAHIILSDYNLEIEWIDEIMRRPDLPEHLNQFLNELRETVLLFEESHR